MLTDQDFDEAWIGDAVLALYARRYILDNPPPGTLGRAEYFQRLTSNKFLSAFGNPTAVEASIGRVYEKEGLDAAFSWIENQLMPLFRKQLHRHLTQRK